MRIKNSGKTQKQGVHHTSHHLMELEEEKKLDRAVVTAHIGQYVSLQCEADIFAVTHKAFCSGTAANLGSYQRYYAKSSSPRQGFDCGT